MADIPDETKETMRRWSETVGIPSDIVKDAAQAGLQRAANISAAATDKAKSTAGKAASSAERAADSVADEATHASDNASQQADQVSGAMTEITGIVEKALHRVQQQTGEITADIGRRAKDQPLASLLVAGTLGYALAYILHSRR
jgi:methyl-accepting chemotaxis protein